MKKKSVTKKEKYVDIMELAGMFKIKKGMPSVLKAREYM